MPRGRGVGRAGCRPPPGRPLPSATTSDVRPRSTAPEVADGRPDRDRLADPRVARLEDDVGGPSTRSGRPNAENGRKARLSRLVGLLDLGRGVGHGVQAERASHVDA